MLARRVLQAFSKVQDPPYECVIVFIFIIPLCSGGRVAISAESCIYLYSLIIREKSRQFRVILRERVPSFPIRMYYGRATPEANLKSCTQAAASDQPRARVIQERDL